MTFLMTPALPCKTLPVYDIFSECHSHTCCIKNSFRLAISLLISFLNFSSMSWWPPPPPPSPAPILVAHLSNWLRIDFFCIFSFSEQDLNSVSELKLFFAFQPGLVHVEFIRKIGCPLDSWFLWMCVSLFLGLSVQAPASSAG